MADNNTNHSETSRPAARRGGMFGGGPGRAMSGGEKPKNFGSALKKLVKLTGKLAPLCIFAVFAALAGSIVQLVGPDKIGRVTDLVKEGIDAAVGGAISGEGGGIDLAQITSIAVFLVILYVIGAVLTLVQGWIFAFANARIGRRLGLSVSEKINRLPLKFFDTTTHGDILSRVTNDIDTLSATLNQSISQLIGGIAMFVGAIVMMAITNWIMCLAAVGSTLVGFALMGIIMKRSQKYFRSNQSQLGKLNGLIEEVYSGHTVVRAYNGEDKAAQEFDGYNSGLYTSNWKSQFFSGLMMPLMNFIGNFGYAVVCVVGALLVVKTGMRIGVITAFMMYIRLFTQPLTQIAQSLTQMQSAAAASERVFDFLDNAEMPDETEKTEYLDPAAAKGEVEFRGVRFGYEEDTPVIRDFSVKVAPGQKVAIVGPTGAGKTTIVNLLMRFYELDGGRILVDGTPIDTLTRENVHALFGMVLQDTWVFEGTVRENVVYSIEGIKDEDVVAACRAVGLDHFIRTLPNGYDTVLTGDSTLSAGEKQLLTIARAMIENAPLIILDEATSSVDTRTELLVQAAMDKLSSGRTAFVIAHRLSTIKNADLILVMQDGDIAESGTHEELLARGGAYASLYNSQFEAV
ncbi:MAG: ABC transporter ATP-binding protein/permease [Oscillospiraceae bacterium]|jgi:ATP-binding cassette subfamily B protein|nr:ABC transporter ATP-binding protein/permease [Oscillospiraceae bacterium]